MNQTKRPERARLGERLVAAMQRTDQWVNNEIPARVTLTDLHGERTEPAMMTRQEVEAWQAAHLPRETYNLILELSHWVGRNPASDEDIRKVAALRRQAEMLLQGQKEAITL